MKHSNQAGHRFGQEATECNLERVMAHWDCCTIGLPRMSVQMLQEPI